MTDVIKAIIERNRQQRADFDAKSSLLLSALANPSEGAYSDAVKRIVEPASDEPLSAEGGIEEARPTDGG